MKRPAGSAGRHLRESGREFSRTRTIWYHVETKLDLKSSAIDKEPQEDDESFRGSLSWLKRAGNKYKRSKAAKWTLPAAFGRLMVNLP